MKKIFFRFFVVCGISIILFLVKPIGVHAAVSIISGGAISGSMNNGQDVTLTFPVGVQQGDVVILYGGHPHRAGTDLGPQTSGYTMIAVNNTDAPNFGAWYKVMGATPDSNVIGYGTRDRVDATAYAAYILRGVDLGVFDQTTTTAGPVTSTNPNPAAITTQTANAWVLALAGSQVNDSTRGPDGTYSNPNGVVGNDSNDITIDGVTREIVSPGPEDPPAWSTWISGAWYAITIALKPELPPANQVTVGTALTQPTYVVEGNSGVVMGAFTFISSASPATVTSIKISEKGTVNANLNLQGVSIRYETAASCVYDGTEALFGSAGSFSASEDASISGSMIVSTSQVCVYVVLDSINTNAGEGTLPLKTIEIEISNVGDVSVNNGSLVGSFPVQIPVTTDIRPDIGEIMSTEIDFDWVPGQTSWGEVIWSTSEPEGDVKLRVYRTASASCDTMLSNAELSGNEAGFDVSQTLSLASLSDVTGIYNKICLKATLIAGASAAPTLNDWAVTWGGVTGYQTSGTYISSDFNAGAAVVFNVIEWQWSKSNPSCASCNVKLQIQTAPDNGGVPGVWTPTWSGPDGNDGDDTDYYTVSTGELIHTDHNGAQWIRYRATLEGDGTATPILSEMSVNYK